MAALELKVEKVAAKDGDQKTIEWQVVPLTSERGFGGDNSSTASVNYAHTAVCVVLQLEMMCH